MRVHKENIYKWSVWKRYNEFDALNKLLLAEVGWQMDSIAFPPAHSLVYNKLAPDFVEARREALNTYWQQILNISRGQLVEFGKHHCSPEIKQFLDVDGAVASGAGMKIGGGLCDSSSSSGGSGTSRRPSLTSVGKTMLRGGGVAA